jgi:16S rRNA (guanine966-N2)-methyltransferase
VRVIAGAFKGRTLTAPRGQRTRPTADRVREAVFSMLGPVDGLRVLDLFAGSGALAVEALSRGAADAVLVERDPRALAAITRNVEATGAAATVRRRDVLAYLRGGSDGPFDLVFVDPPYDAASRLAAPLGEELPKVVSRDARIVIESDKRTPLELPLPLLREREYGDTSIRIYGP